MWILVLFICSMPVSGALWAEKSVRGVVGRAITIDCHYEAKYRSHTKYWCHGRTRQCSILVETKGQHGRSGRMSITDEQKRKFTVTMEDLHSGDTGWYSCGIGTPRTNLMFNVHLQVSDEPPSVPLLRFSPPTSGSSCGDSMSVSCESVHGSLPIQYSWYEKTPSEDSKISDTNKLDLHCQSLKYKKYLYYCKASNNHGEESSEMVNVSISNSVSTCRNVIEVNSTGPIHFCENAVTETMTTAKREELSSDEIPGKKPVTFYTINEHLIQPNVIRCFFPPLLEEKDELTQPTLKRYALQSRIIYRIVPIVIGYLLISFVICVLCYLKRKKQGHGIVSNNVVFSRNEAQKLLTEKATMIPRKWTRWTKMLFVQIYTIFETNKQLPNWEKKELELCIQV
ncbi:uncharacterized protein [Hemitrygon akajei]|uniref:uncharacterized protein n=1 Tax=Hemitrygon akajei TaxID=2704970 RepID=UPI003BFA192F